MVSPGQNQAPEESTVGERDGDALPLLPTSLRSSSSTSELAASTNLFEGLPPLPTDPSKSIPHEPCFLRGGQPATPPQKQVQNKLLAALVLCLVFTALEFFGGFWAHSVAILADAAHMLSDAAGFGISLFAACAVTWRGHSSYSYGFHRAEIIGALLSTLMIWAVTGALVWEAVERVLNPEPVDGKLMFIIASVCILFNIALFFVLGAHSHGLLSHSGEGGCGDHSHAHSLANDGHEHLHVGGHCHAHSHACSHGHGHARAHKGCGHGASHLEGAAAAKKTHDFDAEVPGFLDQGACKGGVVGLCNGKTGAGLCNEKMGGEVCLSSATKVVAGVCGEQHCEEDHPLSSSSGETELCCSKHQLHHRHPVSHVVVPHAHADSSHAHISSGCGHAHNHLNHHSSRDGHVALEVPSNGCCGVHTHQHHHHHSDIESKGSPVLHAVLHAHADHAHAHGGGRCGGCGGHASDHQHHHRHHELHHVCLNEDSGAKGPHAHGSGASAGCCGGHEHFHKHSHDLSHSCHDPHSHSDNKCDGDGDDSDDDCDHGGHEGEGQGHSQGHAHGGCCNHQNMNMRSALLHVLGDLLQSIGVALAGLLIWIKQDDPRWALADPICTLIFAALVLYTTQGIIRDIMRILMQRTPVQHDLAEISDSMVKVKGVHNVHDLHVWDLSLGLPILSAHIDVDAEASADRVLKKLERLFLRRGIRHSTVQVCNLSASIRPGRNSMV